MESIKLRDTAIPNQLVVVRLGTVTLADDRLHAACDRCFHRWGFYGFSVLEVPEGDDFDLLARLRPEVGERRQFLIADGHKLLAEGFPLLPTLDFPHWSVVVAEPTAVLFERVRTVFRGPVANPAYRPSSGGTIAT